MQQLRNDSRALTPRSLVLSLLLGMRHPARPARELVAWCALFGVPDGTARVALSRMVSAGELEHTDGSYRLAGRIAARRSDQDFALAPRLRADHGEWWMELVAVDARSAHDRAALRTALRHARFAERRPGVWMRPANLDAVRLGVVSEQCERFTLRPDDPIGLVRELFAPQDWAGDARRHVGALRRAVPHEAVTPRALARAFVDGAAAVAHLRADPILPAGVLPPRWPGSDLRDEYVAFRRRFGGAVQAWFVDGAPTGR
jgi:phenylacetic acid degradation operon negative regulatory protein